MKTLKISTIYFVLSVLFISCGDDDSIPEIINEEEIITTVTLTLTPGTGDVIILQTRDLDGEGPNVPITTISGALSTNTTYAGSLEFLNETQSPADNITEEVIEEAEEHQVFYTISTGLNITTTYIDFDSNGNPLGTAITLITGEASAGSLRVTLRHEPTKPNTGIDNAGGETDVTTSFNIEID
jgi:hypothetical protein